MHCPTCTCDENPPEPINYCEVNDSACQGDDVPEWKLAICYPCGLPVCRAEGCSRMVRYKTLGKLCWVRACELCIEERTPWGVFPDLGEEET